MIRGRDILEVFAAIVPLYVAMILAYGSVRWWRIFTPDQCSGINRFVAVFAVPLLSFHFISTNNPYSMNYHFLAADSLQKLVVLSALSLCHRLFPRTKSLDWTITLFSLSTLPNTLVMGIPLLRAMYGDFSASLMVQIVVLQSVVWYTLMLFLFEYRAAKALIADHFPPDIAASIASFRVDSDVVSLSAACNMPLQADADVGLDGRLHVSVRRSTAPSFCTATTAAATTTNNNNIKSAGLQSLPSNMTPRASNLTGVEIYSLQSSREPTPRASSFNQSDLYAMFASGGLDEEVGVKFGRKTSASFPLQNSRNLSALSSAGANAPNSSKELHMYVWSASSASPVSEANLRNAANRAASGDLGSTAPPVPKFPSLRGLAMGSDQNVSPMRKGQAEIEDGGSRSPGLKFPWKKTGSEGGLQAEGNQQMPPASVMTRLILIMVWRKLIRNPNTYSSLIGLIWSLVSFRWNIEMPAIIKGSIAILSDAGLGMAMFSLGLFMALQPKIIACGKSVAAFSMAVRFLTGPAVIVATSVAIGVRGVLLHVAIVQAALPQGIVPFVFAKEYNCHPDILSTAVIFGMLIALPITILYYVLLGV